MLKTEKDLIPILLIRARRKVEESLKQGIITKNKAGRLKTRIKYCWHKWWNKYHPLSEDFKTKFNMLYS